MPDTKPFTCVDCGVTGEQRKRGRARLRCEPCKAVHVAAVDAKRPRAERRAVLSMTQCAQCSVAFKPRRHDQLWCSRKCNNAQSNAKFRVSGTLSPKAKERQRLYWQAKNRRRRAAKRGGASEPYTLTQIARRDQSRCGLCGGRVHMVAKVPHPQAPTIDHIVPISEGGDDTRANVQLAHFRCNSVKGARGSQQLALIG